MVITNAVTIAARNGFLAAFLLLAGVLTIPCSVEAQEVEPRRWSHLPVGANFAGGGYAYTSGDIGFDPVLLIEDAEVDKHTAALKYIRSFELFEKSARIDLAQGYAQAHWTGLLDGELAAVRRTGLSDTVVRFAINLLGAPPLKGKEFAAYRAEAEKETIVGAGLSVQLPTGYYLEDKLLNLGTNRFTFRPQLGFVHNRGKWSFELTGSAWLYTDNDEFFDGNRLENDPLYSIEGYLVYTFKPGLWLGAGTAYGAGVQSTVNGIGKDDRRENVAFGVAASYPITKRLGINVKYIGLRTQTSVGSDLNTIAVGFSFMW